MGRGEIAADCWDRAREAGARWGVRGDRVTVGPEGGGQLYRGRAAGQFGGRTKRVRCLAKGPTPTEAAGLLTGDRDSNTQVVLIRSSIHHTYSKIPPQIKSFRFVRIPICYPERRGGRVIYGMGVTQVAARFHLLWWESWGS